MTMSSNINMSVRDFRALKYADIAIDGITLVAGENGCGKSTLSKLLYYSVNNISNYDSLVRKNLYRDMRDVAQLFEIMLRDLPEESEDESINRRSYINEIPNLVRNINDVDTPLKILEDRWILLLREVKKIYSDSAIDFSGEILGLDSSIPISKRIRVSRMNRILKVVLQDDIDDVNLEGNSEYNDVTHETDPFNKIEKFIFSKFEIASQAIDSRPISLIEKELSKIFSESDLPTEFCIKEFGETILSRSIQSTSLLFSINDAIYIDNPMMFAVESSDNPHWNDLKSLLHGSGNTSNEISNLISAEIISGDVESVDENYIVNDFKFKRSDNAIFNLLDMATGIKSFSILQLLIKNGHLNDKTLLIIDEPESNLHPQWVVEYARVIVLLHKKFKVNLFLASHNPDMVSAIRYISEKEGVLDRVNFYLAEKDDGKFDYKYKWLRHDIEPIFESFNIAIDRIDRYGV